MDRATLLTNRALASILFLNLIVASIWYLAHYLTDLDFDNNYLTRKLGKLARSSSTNCDMFLSMAGKLTKTTGLKLSHKEKRKCLIHLIMVTVYLVLSAAVIAADYGIFHLTSSLTQWTKNAPCLSANLNLTFVIEMDIPEIAGIEKFKDDALGFFGGNTNFKIKKTIMDINKRLPWSYDLIPTDCVKKPVPPDLQVICFVGGMYIVTYFMAALDAYAVRIRRRIAASFFQKQEEERISYLYQKILKKCGKDGNRQSVIPAGPSEGGSWERVCAEQGGVGRISQRWRRNERTEEQPATEPATLAMANYRTAEAPRWEMQDSDEEETNF
ncbi:hypothetical protein scyTo_0004854 [Scyliorhinus torazame]|uniref:Dendritic cell-specific transmembrane protein-like domain-containing protein n=2 Tax=Scyliorhinus torazame TaxID=75743 RepID=A0A401NXZ9_SCYTO|nr:hypothetical protein [Scyliorhinus torazame]